MLISSQRYRNDEIVSQKSSAKDYGVLVSPKFEIDGDSYQVVLDGHHSLSAAIEDGEEPDIYEADITDNDAVGLVGTDPVSFLEVVHLGDNYYNVFDGVEVW